MAVRSNSPSFLKFPEVRVVEASAGSGKTYALAKRYVQLILHLSRDKEKPPIHTILAITFTNKAAFEMKERILRLLKQLALGVMKDADRDEILVPLGMSADEAKDVARVVMDGILRNYNYFQVQTIDKFINALLVSSAFQIGLTANFRIRTNAREALALALDELIDEVSTNVAVKKAFDDFLTSMLLVEARSSWMPRDVVLDTVQEMFKEYNTHALDFIRGGVTPEDIIKVKAQVVADIHALADKMPEGANANFVKAVTKFVKTYHSAFGFKSLSAYFEKGKPLPMNKGALVDAWHEDQWEKIQKGLVRAAKLEVEHLYDPYVELFERVRGNLSEACQRDDIVFLSELNAKARLVYEHGIAPEELYYRLAARFEHYLFDEFQDTSILQWQNLKVLPEDGIAKGGSLFYVGDKKQAIYGFRGGDTRLFDHVREQFSDPGYHPTLDRLERSFRSHKSIVEFNNKIFDLANLERFMHLTNDKGERLIPARSEDMEELKRVYDGASQIVVNNAPEGYVKFEVLAGNKKDDYQEDAKAKVLSLIQDLHQRFQWADIAILVRKNGEVEEVSRWLLEEDIPVSSDRTLSIKENPLVMEVAAFLRFLLSPVDNQAFAEFILGDIFLSAAGIKKETVQDFILEWHQKKREGGHAYLYMAFRELFLGAWKGLIEEFFRNIGLYPLYELLVSFYRRMDVLMRFPDSHGFLMRFLELVKSHEEDFRDVSEFMSYFDDLEGEELFVQVISTNAVKVMTVHKAKGLEFPVVILPFLGMSLKATSSGENKALNYTLRVDEEGLKLYHFTSAHLGYSDLAEELDLDETMLMFFSELNNLYVSLTRPAFELYGFLPLRVKNSRNLALDLIPLDSYLSGQPAPKYPQKSKDDEGTPKEVVPLASRDWIDYLGEEFSDVRALSARSERREGILFHAILEKIGAVDDAGYAAVIEQVILASEKSGQLTMSADECIRRVSAFITASDVRPFFFTKAKVLCEKEFANRFGDSRRMDRVLVFDKEVWVVDFKAASFTDEGRKQLGQYLEVLKDVFLGKTPRGFLVSLDGNVEEILYGQNIHH